jgi:hypothetical protein
MLFNRGYALQYAKGGFQALLAFVKMCEARVPVPRHVGWVERSAARAARHLVLALAATFTFGSGYSLSMIRSADIARLRR